MSRALTQAGWEAKAIFRNGEQLMVTFLLPILALLVLLHVDAFALPEPRPAAALAGALAMAVIASGFTSQAIAVAFDRRWGVLRMLSTTPLGPRGLLAGKAVAVGVVVLAQVLVLAVIAALWGGWRPATPAVVPLMAVVAVLGTVESTLFAMICAHP